MEYSRLIEIVVESCIVGTCISCVLCFGWYVTPFNKTDKDMNTRVDDEDVMRCRCTTLKTEKKGMVTMGDILVAMGRIDLGYADEVSWSMNRKTRDAIRRMWSEWTGRPLIGSYLLGYPITVNDDLPDVCTGAVPVLVSRRGMPCVLLSVR
jgi:hypothetical protein